MSTQQETKANRPTGAPTLSACMIVKNEEELLPQCLDSIKDVVDEIIIVDTGSTDRTVEIAESYGAKIYHHPWTGSFSESRNHSIKYATCDWILIVDADEELEKDDIPLLRTVLKNEDCTTIFFQVLSDLPTGVSKNASQRVFRRGKGHYDGIVHNQLVCEGKALVTQIKLYHCGYNLDEERMRKKHKRTEDLLKQQISGDPANVYALSNLVRIYRCQKKWDDAIRTAEGALKLDPHPRNVNELAYQMILCDLTYSLLEVGKAERAEEIGLELVKSYPDNMDGQFYMANVDLAKCDYQRAIRHYMKYIRLTEQDAQHRSKFTALIVDSYESQAQAWNNTGSCYIHLEQFDKAVMAFRKAITHDNELPMYYENLARILSTHGKVDEAKEVLEEALNLGIADSSIHHLLSNTYRSQGEIDQAIEQIRKALEMDSSNTRYHVCLGELLMAQAKLQGETENALTSQNVDSLLKEAEAILNEAYALEPERLEVLHNLARINTLLQREEEASKYIDKIMELDNLSSEKYMHMGNDWIIAEKNDRAIIFYEKSLILDPDNHLALINLATCYAKLGMYESAMTGYRAALTMKPDDPTIRQNLLTMEREINEAIMAGSK